MNTRVLCIDDEQDQCDLLGSALSRMGFEPTTTTSPAEALELAAREPFDIVVTDLGMGEMDGLSLCGRMIGASPCIPIIVLTGQKSMEMAIGAMRAGAYDFLTKPVEADLLLASLTRAARHHRLIQRATASSIRARRAVQYSHTVTYARDLDSGDHGP